MTEFPGGIMRYKQTPHVIGNHRTAICKPAGKIQRRILAVTP